MYFQMASAHFGFVSQALGRDSIHSYVVSAYFGTVSQGMEQQILYIFTWYPHTLAWFRKAWIGTIYVILCGIHMIWLAKVRSKRS